MQNLYFDEELFNLSLKKQDEPGKMPVQYKIIKTITYLLYGFEKIAQNRNNERIFTERFETNIALYISSLVVQFGIEDEKLKEIISKINLRLTIR